ncbi:potassium-transporting ATPase subunit B 2 [Staphylococcus aureus]|nr:potassium-transporting ATPase subunit B 2 [Staphylococcus aureus]
MTRGALTTFSLANDVAKYFAILPALMMSTIPEMTSLNIMHLSSPKSAIISALIFNALIIVALIPIAMKGVKPRIADARHISTSRVADLIQHRKQRGVLTNDYVNVLELNIALDKMKD